MELNPSQIEHIEYILKNMDDSVCVTDMNGDMIYANPAAEKLFGLSIQSHGKIWDAIPFVEGNDALIQLFIDGVMEKTESIRALVDYVNNDGTLHHLHVTLRCGSGESGMVVIVISDLTHLTRVHSAFARYTSPEIAAYVLTAPDGEKQGGHAREASILISDLRGFTAMSTHLSGGALIRVLNHYFECMAAVIQRFGGTIIEFLGDGIFVVFGAPNDMPDHAEAAVACAVEMQSEMAAVNAWNRQEGYPDLAMGIGISSGSVVVGNIGSDKKMKYGCMGETVNMAGRLETFSISGEIYISEETRKRISRNLVILSEKSFMPKGGRQEMKIYNVAGIGEEHVLAHAGEKPRWKALPQAKEVLFYFLDGKCVNMTPNRGRLTDISEDEKFGMLETSAEMETMKDLMLKLDGRDVYAKVVEEKEGGYSLGFTGKPEDFSALLA